MATRPLGKPSSAKAACFRARAVLVLVCRLIAIVFPLKILSRIKTYEPCRLIFYAALDVISCAAKGTR